MSRRRHYPRLALTAQQWRVLFEAISEAATGWSDDTGYYLSKVPVLYRAERKLSDYHALITKREVPS